LRIFEIENNDNRFVSQTISMIIANPIYDTVFKYLMEDTDIAKGVLSVILNSEITELTLRPQERTSESALDDRQPVNIYCLDFIAVIKESSGTHKKALIELQKTKRSTNIQRFRKYLGENYQKEDKLLINGKEKAQSLEIVTIYFLGFELDDVPTSVLKVKNCFIDVTTGKQLEYEPFDKFIRLLNHESYTVQIPKLHPNEQSRVENVLNIFSQRYQTDDEHKLNYSGNMSDPLVEKIVNRLTRAIADQSLRDRMDIEDEIEREYQDIKERYQDQLEQKDKAIEQKDKVIEKKEHQLEEQNQLIEDLKRQLADKNKK
jgi:hypothetical protein